MVRDSRSWRHATAFARFGWRSVVVEGVVSDRAIRFPDLEVISLRHAALPGSGETLCEENRPVRSLIKKNTPQSIWALGGFIWFVWYYWVVTVIRGARIVPKADIYYMHEFRLFPLAWLLCRRDRAKLVYDAHDFYAAVHDPSGMSAFWKLIFMPFQNWMEGLCIARADAVVTVSDGVASLFRNAFGVVPSVIRNCHDYQLDGVDAGSLRALVGVPEDAFLIVVVGNRKPGQAVKMMLHALCDLPDDYHVAFVGRFYESEKQAAIALGLEGRVHTPGAVYPDQVVPLIRDADAAAILYFPFTVNYARCLPNGLFQSMAAGLPIVYPRLEEIVRVLADWPNAIEIDPCDVHSVREGLQTVRAAVDRGPTKMTVPEDILWRSEEKKLHSVVRALWP